MLCLPPTENRDPHRPSGTACRSAKQGMAMHALTGIRRKLTIYLACCTARCPGHGIGCSAAQLGQPKHVLPSTIAHVLDSLQHHSKDTL